MLFLSVSFVLAFMYVLVYCFLLSRFWGKTWFYRLSFTFLYFLFSFFTYIYILSFFNRLIN